MSLRQPSFYVPHGGGPCFFMEDPQGTWRGMERFLRELPTGHLAESSDAGLYATYSAGHHGGLRDQAEGTEAQSGLTSPKRYLFDITAQQQPWRFQ